MADFFLNACFFTRLGLYFCSSRLLLATSTIALTKFSPKLTHQNISGVIFDELYDTLLNYVSLFTFSYILTSYPLYYF